MAQIVSFDFVHGIGLTLTFGCHKAVISAVFWPINIFTEELNLINTGSLTINYYLADRKLKY